MTLSTDDLVLAPDAAIDLQTHTNLSDGTWTPDALIAHAATAGIALIAITDHDRPDTVGEIQRLAIELGQPVLVAAEISTSWNGEYTDVLCYGFDPAAAPLIDLAQMVQRRQRENTTRAVEKLSHSGISLPDDEIAEIVALPGSMQPRAVVSILQRHGHNTAQRSAGTLAREMGVDFETVDIAVAVEAAHASGGVCIIAHPGRGDGFTKYDPALLDELRRDAPIDGIEAYYPRHTDIQTAMFADYTAANKLLISAGSDSHGPDRPPLRYPAERCRALLERVGVTVL